MLEAANNHVLNINTSVVIVVGDGASPRTGAIFAYYTKAEVTSIDPVFNIGHWCEHVAKQTVMGFPPQRLSIFDKRIEDLKSLDCKNRQVIVVWPHSHACMNNCKVHNYTKRVDIAMPCCVKIPSNWLFRPHIVYEDKWVLSPHKTIHIWNDDL